MRDRVYFGGPDLQRRPAERPNGCWRALWACLMLLALMNVYHALDALAAHQRAAALERRMDLIEQEIDRLTPARTFDPKHPDAPEKWAFDP